MNPEIEKLIDEGWNTFENDIEKGRQLCDQARQLSEELGDPLGVAYSLRNSGMIHQVTGNFQEALAELEQSLNLFLENGYKPGEVSARNCLANTYWRSNDLQKSLSYHLENLPLRRELGDVSGEAATLNNIGLNYLDLGHYASALEYFSDAKNLFERAANDEGLGLAYNNISTIYEKLGDDNKALDFQFKSLEYKRKVGVKLGEISTLVNIGNTYRRKDQLEEALKIHNQVLSLARELDNKPLEALVLINLGDDYQTQGNYQQALEYHQNAQVMFKECGEQFNEILAVINAGSDLIKLGRVPEAVNQLKLAIQEAEASQTSELEYQANLALSQAYEQAGNFELALTHLRICSKVKEKMFGTEAERKITNTLIKIEVEQTRRESEAYRVKNEELRQANEKITLLFENLQEISVELERQTWEDGLTKAFNRRYLDKHLSSEFERSRRFSHPLSVAMIDIDNFKRVNDQFSHQIGDDVLKHFTKIIQQHIRVTDTLGRYGGEEFMIIFVESNLDASYLVCERVRNAINSHLWAELHPELKVTASLGLACTPAASPLALVEQADQNLYKAKRNGKNQVCTTFDKQG